MREKPHLKQIIICVAIFSFIYSLPAYSDIIGIEYWGVINEVKDSNASVDWSELEDHFKVGGVISGEFYYSSDADIIESKTDESGTLTRYATNYAEVSSDGFTGYTPSTGLSIIDNYQSDRDQYGLWADHFNNVLVSTGLSLPLYAFNTSLCDHSGTAFDSSELPLTAPNLSSFDESTIELLFVKDLVYPNDGFFVVYATMTHIATIPEPATILLLGLGISTLLRKRRKS